MAQTTAREQKLIQYLNEAYGKEKQLETELQRQIPLFDKAQIKKRLREHLKETKTQAKGLERRIKQLGGKAEFDLPGPDVASDAAAKVASVANKAVAAAKGPIATLRGTSEADNQLRNLRDAFWNEAEEIAHYSLIEALATALSDRDTAKLAKEYRRQEERMQKFIEKQIPQAVKNVVRSEVPAKERKPATASSNGRAASSRAKPATSRAKSTSSRAKSTTSRAKSTTSRAKSASSGSGTRRAASSRAKSGSGSSASRTRASSSRSSSRSSGSSARTRRPSGGSSSGGSSS